MSIFFTGEIYRKWINLRYKCLQLNEDTVALLHELRKHYLLGLITNGPSTSQWEKVEKLNLRRHFDIILVSGDLPWEKPHRMIFQKACDHLNLKPNQCLMVGDKLETDILGGIRAKLAGTVWIPLNQRDPITTDFHPDYIIDNIKDLPSLLTMKNDDKNHLNGPDLNDSNSNASDGS